MTMQERNKARKLQDRLIALAEKRGYPDDMRVSVDLPASVTLAELRRFIFPEYDTELRQVIAKLEANR